MYWIITKFLLTAAVVVAVSEVAKRCDRLGALVAALPMVTILALIWMYLEGQSAEKLNNHAWYTFWYVVPNPSYVFGIPFFTCKVQFLGHIRFMRSYFYYLLF